MEDTKRESETDRYLSQAEDEEQRYGRNKDTAINHAYISSGSYRRKFDLISNSLELNKLIYQLSKKMLEHRSGTKYEDMYWVDAAAKKVVAEETGSSLEEQIIYSNSILSKIQRSVLEKVKEYMEINA